MVRISSKLSHCGISNKESSCKESTELNSNMHDQTSSSKILNVVRQALLNAAEELASQQLRQDSLNNLIPFHTFNVNDNDLNKSHQRNRNASGKKKLEKKKVTCKNKKTSNNNRRK